MDMQADLELHFLYGIHKMLPVAGLGFEQFNHQPKISTFLSPSRPTDAPQSTSPTNMAHPLSSLITRSFSSPNPTQGPSSSIWDIEPSAMAPGITAAELEAQLKVNKY